MWIVDAFHSLVEAKQDVESVPGLSRILREAVTYGYNNETFQSALSRQVQQIREALASEQGKIDTLEASHKSEIALLQAVITACNKVPTPESTRIALQAIRTTMVEKWSVGRP